MIQQRSYQDPVSFGQHNKIRAHQLQKHFSKNISAQEIKETNSQVMRNLIQK